MRKIWIAIVKLCGWKFRLPESGSRPELQRCIIATAPHTSAADYLVGTAYLWCLGVNGKIFIKDDYFKWPLGGLLRRLGCIAIDRGNRHNDMVGAAVREFAKGEPLTVVITPEGTRKATKRWKRGFWEIAHQAGVPVVPAYIDFSKKEVGIFPTITTTDDYEADLARLRSLYRKEMAKHPDQFIELKIEK